MQHRFDKGYYTIICGGIIFMVYNALFGRNCHSGLGCLLATPKPPPSPQLGVKIYEEKEHHYFQDEQFGVAFVHGQNVRNFPASRSSLSSTSLVWDPRFRGKMAIEAVEQWRNPGCLKYMLVGDEKLPNYVGIIIYIYKDLY